MDAEPATAQLTVLLENGNDTSLPIGEIRIVAQPRETDLATVEKTLTIEGSDEKTITLELELPARTLWTVSAERDGAWIEEKNLYLESSGNVAHLKLWPTGILRAQLSAPAQYPHPSKVRARFIESPKPRKLGQFPDERPTPAFEGETACEVIESLASCPLPAGRVDFSIHTEGFAAHYFWGRQIKAGERRLLGRLTLVPGASLSGWVEIGEGSGAINEVTVELGPRLAAAETNQVSQERFRRLARTSTVNDRGFFQFKDINTGGHTLFAKLESYAPAGPFHVEVVEGLETALREPLVLNLPEELEVYVEPTLAPDGFTWIVKFAELGRIPGHFDALFEAVADTDGHARLENLRPGPYLVFVEDRVGHKWHGGEIEVVDDPPPYEVKLDLVKVRGELTVGKEPLEAMIWFGGRFGSTQVRMDSNPEGEFRGLLPREGSWLVDIRARAPRISRSLEGIDVEVRPGKSAAFVEISLPATRIPGVVVDERGEPVERALLRVRNLEGEKPRVDSVLIDQDDMGRFELVGYPEGSLLLSADAPGGLKSERVRVDVTENAPSPEVRLVIRPLPSYEGRIVTSEGRPVPGAAIDVTPLGVPASFIESAVARVDGSFPIKVPHGAQSAMLTVLPPGFALRNAVVSLKEGEAVEVAVSPYGGTLEILMPAADSEHGKTPAPRLYDAQGIALAPQLLTRWAAMNGDPAADLTSFRVPQVQAGEYKLCREGGESSPDGDCVSGYLPPLGHLRLELPAGSD